MQTMDNTNRKTTMDRLSIVAVPFVASIASVALLAFASLPAWV